MRRRLASAVVVAAVAAVAIAAVVDAIGRPGAEQRPDVASELRALGVEGVLVYSQRDCGVAALTLPELERVSAPEGADRACELGVSADGRRAAAGRARWSPDGTAFAVCREGETVVTGWPPHRNARSYDGCAPAWRPDGVLTVARDGAIVEALTGQELVSRRVLRAAAGRHPTLPDPPDALGPLSVRDVAWLSPSRALVILRSTLRGTLGRIGPPYAVVLFSGGRPVAAFATLRPLERLDLSPDGRLVAVQPDTVLDLEAGLAELPLAPPGSRRLAWSPDGRWLAAATPVRVLLAEVRSGRRVDLQLATLELAWR